MNTTLRDFEKQQEARDRLSFQTSWENTARWRHYEAGKAIGDGIAAGLALAGLFVAIGLVLHAVIIR